MMGIADRKVTLMLHPQQAWKLKKRQPDRLFQSRVMFPNLGTVTVIKIWGLGKPLGWCVGNERLWHASRAILQIWFAEWSRGGSVHEPLLPDHWHWHHWQDWDSMGSQRYAYPEPCPCTLAFSSNAPEADPEGKMRECDDSLRFYQKLDAHAGISVSPYSRWQWGSSSMWETMPPLFKEPEWIGKVRRMLDYDVAWAVASAPDLFGKKRSGKLSSVESIVLCRIWRCLAVVISPALQAEVAADTRERTTCQQPFDAW